MSIWGKLTLFEIIIWIISQIKIDWKCFPKYAVLVWNLFWVLKWIFTVQKIVLTVYLIVWRKFSIWKKISKWGFHFVWIFTIINFSCFLYLKFEYFVSEFMKNKIVLKNIYPNETIERKFISNSKIFCKPKFFLTNFFFFYCLRKIIMSEFLFVILIC